MLVSVWSYANIARRARPLFGDCAAESLTVACRLFFARFSHVMQSFLIALTAAQRDAQWQKAETAAAEAALDVARRLAEKKRPGRPCKTHSTASSVVSEEPAEKKRKCMQWFSSPLIHDILQAYIAATIVAPAPPLPICSAAFLASPRRPRAATMHLPSPLCATGSTTTEI